MKAIPQNSSLGRARNKKNDEFYTQLPDIERELKHYKIHFYNKVVYCNCDDPRISNFFHYFTHNFKKLGLKKVIATCYKNQDPNIFTTELSDKAVYLEYDGSDWTGAPDPAKIDVNPLRGDGDFRSQESIELLKKADIIVTNPPFSLFREYVKQLMDHKKQFIIIGNRSALTYKDIFTYLRDNKMWLGYGFASGNAYFKIPADATREFANGVYDQATGLVKFRLACWFTNLDISKRHEKLILFKMFSKKDYSYFDNYNAINVNKVKDIPIDYDGYMGVPITFMDHYNPEQFEILGLIAGNIRGLSGIPLKGEKDGPYINGKLIYGRIIIKNKNPIKK